MDNSLGDTVLMPHSRGSLTSGQRTTLLVQTLTHNKRTPCLQDMERGNETLASAQEIILKTSGLALRIPIHNLELLWLHGSFHAEDPTELTANNFPLLHAPHLTLGCCVLLDCRDVLERGWEFFELKITSSRFSSFEPTSWSPDIWRGPTRSWEFWATSLPLLDAHWIINSHFSC